MRQLKIETRSNTPKYIKNTIGALLFLLLIVGVVILLQSSFWITILSYVFVSLLVFFACYLLYVNFFASTDERERNMILQKEFYGKVNENVFKHIALQRGSLNSAPEQKVMTILFADVRGFTTLSESMDSVAVFTLINNYLTRMSKIITGNDGTIDKYIGDAIMAFWNAPLDVTNHQEKAVRSAIEICSELEEFNHEIGFELDIGVGVDTGVVTVGNLGNDANFDYTVMGDHVNTASRLEALTKKYSSKVLISENVIADSHTFDSEFLYREVDSVVLKGKKKALTIYEPMVNSLENRDKKYIYESALRQYRNGDFANATSLFNKQRKDQISRCMVSRIREFKTIPEGWDGVWVWDSK